jgi:hypothetical protein
MRQSALPARGGQGARGRAQPPVSGAKVRGIWLGLAFVVLLLAVAGTGLLVQRRSAAPIDDTAALGGLSVRLHDAGWVSMDHTMDNQGGYQMPAQMMPGAPVGDDMRFGVPLSLVNTSGDVRGFNLAEEFFLRGGRTEQPRALHSDTFGQLARLGPGNGVDGVLYFDTVVPDADDPPLYLEWRRDGDTTTLAIPLLAGGAPDHGGHPR